MAQDGCRFKLSGTCTSGNSAPDCPQRTFLRPSQRQLKDWADPRPSLLGQAWLETADISLAPVTGSGESREPWGVNQKLEFCRND